MLQSLNDVVGTISSSVSLSPTDHVDTPACYKRQKHCQPCRASKLARGSVAGTVQQPPSQACHLPIFVPKKEKKKAYIGVQCLESLHEHMTCLSDTGDEQCTAHIIDAATRRHHAWLLTVGKPSTRCAAWKLNTCFRPRLVTNPKFFGFPLDTCMEY